jgi:sulfur carrier protein
VITVNGERRDLPDGATISDVVATLVNGSLGRGVAVAVNGEVLPRASWADTVVSDGDSIEVLSATQGG